MKNVIEVLYRCLNLQLDFFETETRYVRRHYTVFGWGPQVLLFYLPFHVALAVAEIADAVAAELSKAVQPLLAPIARFAKERAKRLEIDRRSRQKIRAIARQLR